MGLEEEIMFDYSSLTRDEDYCRKLDETNRIARLYARKKHGDFNWDFDCRTLIKAYECADAGMWPEAQVLARQAIRGKNE